MISPAVTLYFASGEELAFAEVIDQGTGAGLIDQKPPGKLYLVAAGPQHSGVM